jgi:hypothetical protein
MVKAFDRAGLEDCRLDDDAASDVCGGVMMAAAMANCRLMEVPVVECTDESSTVER